MITPGVSGFGAELVKGGEVGQQRKDNSHFDLRHIRANVALIGKCWVLSSDCVLPTPAPCFVTLLVTIGRHHSPTLEVATEPRTRTAF